MGSVNSSKRLALCGSSSDMISNLPSNILDNILTCLPMEDAAKTCVLSKSWRFRWRHSPQLVFDHAYFRSRPYTSCNEFSIQIFQILLLHQGPLRRFDLLISTDVDIKPSFMDQFLLFLTGKGIQEFTFRPSFDTDKIYSLPSMFFQCIQLTHLNLSECRFQLPIDFIGFRRLISLEVHYVDVPLSHLDFNTFISKCPLLQRLKVEVYSMFMLEIDAPNLKYLYFACMNTFISFKNVPVLSTVVIQRYSPCPFDIAEVFGNSLPAIHDLCAHARFLVDGFKRLPSMSNHLRYVELSRMPLNSMEEVQSALLLIKNSPNLQKLKIRTTRSYTGDDGTLIVQHLKALSLTEDTFNQLEEVSINDYNGSMVELEFVKFILAKSPVLKKLTIDPPYESSADKKLEIVTAITIFERASTTAKVFFNRWW